LPIGFETVSVLQDVRVRRQKDTKVVPQRSWIWVSRDALREVLDYVCPIPCVQWRPGCHFRDAFLGDDCVASQFDVRVISDCP